MRKVLVWLLALVLSTSIVLTSCAPAKEEIPRLAKEELKELDFEKLNDVEWLLSKESVFWSLKGEEIDRAEVAQKVLEAVFVHLQMTPDQIPEWAVAIKDKAVAEAQEKIFFKGRVDYGFLNEAFNKLLEDPEYRYLSSPYEKLKLWEAAVRGFINAIGDPFASYGTPFEVKLGLTEPDKGTYEGIGIYLDQKEGKIVITGVIKGTPAEKAGLQIGDKIIMIDGMSLEGATVKHIQLYIKQKNDPNLTLMIEREDKQVEEIEIRKEKIKQVLLQSWPGVDLSEERENTAKDLPYNFPLVDREGNSHQDIAYLKIKDFSLQMVKDLHFVLSSIDWENYKGLIIDLRENPGGLVHSVAATTSYFLSGGTLYIEQDAQGHKTKIMLPTTKESGSWGIIFEPDLFPKDLPVVILVGSNSYSGAELFPAALRDNGRAVLVGKERTGGKGTVNRWFELEKGEYGALYIAISLWLTPEGKFIEPLRQDEEGGLLPDYLVEWTDEDYFEHGQNMNYDPEIFQAIDIIKSKK